MLATSRHSESVRFADSLHLVTKDVVWNAAGPSKQLKGKKQFRVYAQPSHRFVSCRTELAENLRGMRLLNGSIPPPVATFEFSLPNRTGVGFGVQKEMDSSPEKVRSGRFIH